MALPSSAQAACIISAAPARPPAAARASLPSVFKRVDISEFSGLKSTSGCITYGRQVRENSLSLFDALASQVIRKAGNSGGAVKGETVAKLRVAINGFGRIGRNFLRCWHGRKHSPIDVVAVNDIVGIQHGVNNAIHLLKYDSIMGTFQADVRKVSERTMSVDGNKIFIFSNKDPSQLPWSHLGIDLVIDATGVFVNRSGAEKHIHAGAKKVIITAPPSVGEDIPTFVMGVNERNYSHEVHTNIISNASGSTNCLAPLLKILNDDFGGIEKGTVTTTLSYTSDQSLLDALNCDVRRARAATLNIVPTTTTDIAKSLSTVLPDLKLESKLKGIALRVPTPNVSAVDLVVNVGKKGISAEDVNRAFRNAADGPLKGILAVSGDHLVSMDFRGSNVSATVDESLTMVMGDDMVKVVAWYDNEWGYSQRVLDLAHIVEHKWPAPTHRDTGEIIDYEQICRANPETAECVIHDT